MTKSIPWGKVETISSVGFAEDQTEVWQGNLPELKGTRFGRLKNLFAQIKPFLKIKKVKRAIRSYCTKRPLIRLRAGKRSIVRYCQKPAFVRGMSISLTVCGCYVLVSGFFPKKVQAVDYPGAGEAKTSFVSRTTFDYLKTWVSLQAWKTFFRTGELTPEFEYFLQLVKSNAVPFMIGAGAGFITAGSLGHMRNMILKNVILQDLTAEFDGKYVLRQEEHSNALQKLRRTHHENTTKMMLSQVEEKQVLKLLHQNKIEASKLGKTNFESLLNRARTELQNCTSSVLQRDTELIKASEYIAKVDGDYIRKSRDHEICFSVLNLDTKPGGCGKTVLKLTNEIIRKDHQFDVCFLDLIHKVDQASKCEKDFLSFMELNPKGGKPGPTGPK